MYDAGSRRQPHPSEWPGHSAARVPVPVRRSRTRAHRVGCDRASRLRPAPPRPRAWPFTPEGQRWCSRRPAHEARRGLAREPRTAGSPGVL